MKKNNFAIRNNIGSKIKRTNTAFGKFFLNHRWLKEKFSIFKIDKTGSAGVPFLSRDFVCSILFLPRYIGNVDLTLMYKFFARMFSSADAIL